MPLASVAPAGQQAPRQRERVVENVVSAQRRPFAVWLHRAPACRERERECQSQPAGRAGGRGRAGRRLQVSARRPQQVSPVPPTWRTRPRRARGGAGLSGRSPRQSRGGANFSTLGEGGRCPHQPAGTLSQSQPAGRSTSRPAGRCLASAGRYETSPSTALLPPPKHSPGSSEARQTAGRNVPPRRRPPSLAPRLCLLSLALSLPLSSSQQRLARRILSLAPPQARLRPPRRHPALAQHPPVA
jgi:hypothetical protein